MARLLAKLAGVVVLTLIGCELALRVILFSGLFRRSRLADPALYFNYFTDDRFWELNYLTDERYGRSTDQPGDRMLGWIWNFDSKTFLHHNAAAVGRRRPVLLYGDSFAECTTRKCFQQYLNEDPRFSRKCYFLNYGVGGHGIDQTYLTFHNSVRLYEKPIVIYSLLIQDMDRAALKMFVKPKPYFLLENGKLVLKGVPVENADHFIREHPFNVPSYLYLLLSRNLASAFEVPPEKRLSLTALSDAILGQAIKELQSRRVDFFFLIFLDQWDLRADPHSLWRLMAIESFLKKEHVPFVVTSDLLKPAMDTRRLKPNDLFGNDNHPNDEQNRIIAEELRRRLAPCYSPASR